MTVGVEGAVRRMMMTAVVLCTAAAMPRWARAMAPTAAPPARAPRTALGQAVETLLLALRPAVVLVPVGIVAAGVRRSRAARAFGTCDQCGLTAHATDAAYCRRCGDRLTSVASTSL